MGQVYKVLGQVNPGATTLTVLYTVPALTSTVVSSVIVCNEGAAGTFRVSVAVAGAADNAKQYLFYDVAIGANTSITATLGISLATTDVVKCYASSTDMAFNLFGVENT